MKNLKCHKCKNETFKPAMKLREKSNLVDTVNKILLAPNHNQYIIINTMVCEKCNTELKEFETE